MLNELDLHVTNRCTTKCNYCCFSSNRKSLPEMGTETIVEMLNEAKTLGVEHIHFTGGEPLLRDDILQIVSYANKLNLDMRMQTNGMLLSEELANKLYNSGMKSIMISLDSDTPAIHDKVRGQGTWDAAVKAIKIAKKTGMNVRVNSVLTTENYKGVFETILFVKSLGIHNYSAFYFSPIGCGAEHINYWIEPKEYLNFWCDLQHRIETEKSISDMNIIIEKGYATWEEASQIDTRNFTGCGGGCLNTYHNRDYLILRCDGNIYPCIMAIDSKPLGNIYKSSLTDIYKNSEVWNYLIPKESTQCEKCGHSLLCNGGCRYYPFENEDNHDSRCIYNEIVPLCPIMKYNSKNKNLGGSSEDVLV